MSKAAPQSSNSANPMEVPAEILEIFGNHSFDIESASSRSINESCKQWAQSLLHLPDSWKKIRSQFSDLRIREKAFVVSTFTDIRTILWSLIQVFGSESREGLKEDQEINLAIEHLKEALNEENPGEFRKQATEQVTRIAHLQYVREARFRSYRKRLRKYVASLERELNMARVHLSLDPLTGLYNRKSLDEHFDRLLDLFPFTRKPMHLIMVDVNEFKQINDTHGHAIGDEVIAHIGRELLKSFPGRNEFVARYGGDEFAVLLSETPDEEAKVLAQRLQKRIQEHPFQSGNLSLPLSVSAGVASLRASDSVKTWIERADKSMYRSKRKKSSSSR